MSSEKFGYLYFSIWSRWFSRLEEILVLKIIYRKLSLKVILLVTSVPSLFKVTFILSFWTRKEEMTDKTYVNITWTYQKESDFKSPTSISQFYIRKIYVNVDLDFYNTDFVTRINWELR